MKKAYKPIPEAIIAGNWYADEITDTNLKGMVDIKQKRLSVPFGDDDTSQGIRAHEYSHVRFSPEKKTYPSNKFDASVKAVEDARVNYLASKAGVTAIRHILTKKHADTLLFMANMVTSPLERALAYISIEGLDVAGYVRKNMLLSEKDKDYLDGIIKQLKANPVFEQTEETAKSLIQWEKDFLDNKEKDIPTPSKDDGQPSLNLGIKGGGDTITPTPFMKPPKDLIEVIKEVLDKTPHSKKKRLVFHYGDNPRWGEIFIIDLPKPRTLKLIPKPGISDFGMILYRPERIITDGRIFKGQKKHICYGSILIDNSGSMSVVLDHVKQLVNVSAGVKIALYGGATSYPKDHGKLWIVASEGMAVNEFPNDFENYKNNLIDLPALQWLATQDKPRIWVSDGRVTGISDGYHVEDGGGSLRREVMDFIKAHDIYWINANDIDSDTLKEITEILRNTKK